MRGFKGKARASPYFTKLGRHGCVFVGRVCGVCAWCVVCVGGVCVGGVCGGGDVCMCVRVCVRV